ncbi:hypothetical protein Salat_2152000 [Sesamum alatum]|uniref:Uncharacterized protein n=1 Tax=Sesamum alatum TaxID=300844 RepID=A0AAE2CH55_9LAMI|nr:hypothetical protein Salat_2152000 [Sesamum alatum]
MDVSTTPTQVILISHQNSNMFLPFLKETSFANHTSCKEGIDSTTSFFFDDLAPPKVFRSCMHNVQPHALSYPHLLQQILKRTVILPSRSTNYRSTLGSLSKRSAFFRSQNSVLNTESEPSTHSNSLSRAQQILGLCALPNCYTACAALPVAVCTRPTGCNRSCTLSVAVHTRLLAITDSAHRLLCSASNQGAPIVIVTPPTARQNFPQSPTTTAGVSEAVAVCPNCCLATAWKLPACLAPTLPRVPISCTLSSRARAQSAWAPVCAPVYLRQSACPLVCQRQSACTPFSLSGWPPSTDRPAR